MPKKAKEHSEVGCFIRMAEVVRYRVKILAHRSMQQVMGCLGVQFGSKPAQGRLVDEYILRKLQGMKARGSYQRKRGSLQEWQLVHAPATISFLIHFSGVAVHKQERRGQGAHNSTGPKASLRDMSGLNIRFASLERGIGFHAKCSRWQMIGLTIQLPRRLSQPIWDGIASSFNEGSSVRFEVWLSHDLKVPEPAGCL